MGPLICAAKRLDIITLDLFVWSYIKNAETPDTSGLKEFN